MLKVEGAPDWRSARRQSAREAILTSAWAAVRDEGLADLSLRDLARRSGITTPTVYAYFDSKNDIYDAMFGQAAAAFLHHMTAPYDTSEPRAMLATSLRRFVDFCTADFPRYQLLFQRAVPGFTPSPESYAPAVGALERSAEVLVANGLAERRHLDVWTALTTGLVSQQIANDPGGDRWVVLIDDFVAMFLSYFQQSTRPIRPAATPVRRRP